MSYNEASVHVCCVNEDYPVLRDDFTTGDGSWPLRLFLRHSHLEAHEVDSSEGQEAFRLRCGGRSCHSREPTHWLMNEMQNATLPSFLRLSLRIAWDPATRQII